MSEGQHKHNGMRLRTRDGGSARCSLLTEVEDDGQMAGLAECDNGGDDRRRYHLAFRGEDVAVGCGSATWWRTDERGSRVR